MSKIKKIGIVDKKEIFLFTLTNNNGYVVQITNYGGIIMSIRTPDKQGIIGEITLGYDTLHDYIDDTCYMGAIIGRCANRINSGIFSLGEQKYRLKKNHEKHHLHGGEVGFNKKVWEVLNIKHNNIQLRYLSPDMEEGYPGNLQVVVTYRLDDSNSLSMRYEILSDQRTICNLTYHPYFNLQGYGAISTQEIRINGQHICEIDSDSIPNGNIKDITNTVFDFRSRCSIQQQLDRGKECLKQTRGFDHNWVLSKVKNAFDLAVSVYDPLSGRRLDMYTDRPGIQFYTGNSLDGVIGKGGTKYTRHSGFCIEPQGFPDAPNHAHFPSIVVEPHVSYYSKTKFHFSTMTTH